MSESVKWIKIVTDIFEDEKIMLIETLPEADSIIVIWFKLLCLAGKQNNSGVFLLNNKIAYTDSMLSAIFRRNENVVKLALKTFEEFGMIQILDNVITIPNWDKHQQLDKFELAKEQTRKRVAKYREKQKMLITSETSNVTCNVTVTESNADRLDIDKIHNITLNNFYNYIYKGASFEKLNDTDKIALINVLKKLDIYVENQKMLIYLSAEQKLDLLIQHWVVKEIYLTAYNVYLNKLCRDDFICIYNRCKNKIREKDSELEVDRFISYLIKSLQNHFVSQSR